MEELVSVVVPAFRAESFIRRAVDSVLAQTWRRLEVVIASDDGVDYARLLRDQGVADARVRCVFTRGVGTGAASARNAGLAACAGSIVATLDADDTLAPDALAKLAPLAVLHGAAYAGVRLVDGAGAEMASYDRRIPSGPVGLEEILTSQVHTFAGVVFDRRRVSAAWPAWMDRWEDVYFYVRCFDDVEAMYHVAEPLYTYHRTPGSICNRPETGPEYLAWAAELADRLERGERLGLGNPASRETFRRFLRSRHVIEAEFVEAARAGLCDDYRAFIPLRIQLFHDLDAGAAPAPVLSGVSSSAHG